MRLPLPHCHSPRTLWRLAAALLMCLLLQGCLHVHTNIEVLPDGSAVITDVLSVSDAVQALKQDPRKLLTEIGSPKNLAERTQAIGQGVHISAGPIWSQGGRLHRRIRIQVPRIDGFELPMSPTGQAQPTGATPPKKLAFAFVKDAEGVATLRIDNRRLGVGMPASTGLGSTAPEAPGDPQAQALQQMAQQMVVAMVRAMEGMAVSIRVSVQGEVVSSSAAFSEGRTLTLMDMDTAAMVAQPGWEQGLLTMPPPPAEGTACQVAQPGLRVDCQNEVVVRFRAPR